MLPETINCSGSGPFTPGLSLVTSPRPAVVVAVAETRSDAEAGVLTGIPQSGIPLVVLAPRPRHGEPAEDRRVVLDDVGAAQARPVDGVAAEQVGPAVDVAVHVDHAQERTGGGEAAVPVADGGVGRHAGAAEVDGGQARRRRVGAADRETAEALVVEVPVRQRHGDLGVAVRRHAAGIVVELVDLMAAGARGDRDDHLEARRQAGRDLGRPGERHERAASRRPVRDVNVPTLDGAGVRSDSKDCRTRRHPTP